MLSFFWEIVLQPEPFLKTRKPHTCKYTTYNHLYSGNYKFRTSKFLLLPKIKRI